VDLPVVMPFKHELMQVAVESRQPLWKGGSGAYIPFAKGGAEVSVERTEEMV
jgi:hypothetical protein